MKKKIVLIVVAVVILVVGYLAWELFISDFIRDTRRDNDRINNSKTLSQYVEYHTPEYTGGTLDSLNFYAQDIKCDLLKDRDILYYGDDILVLDDFTIYETAFTSDKTYSNGQQYKQIATDIEIKGIKIAYYTLYLISEDNIYYQFNLTDKSLMKSNSGELYKIFLDDNSVIKFVDATPNEYADIFKKYVVLKNDGQVYEQEYEIKYTTKWEYTLLSENVLLSTKDYGHITDFDYTTGRDYTIGRDYIGITRIVSDKGLYYLKQTSDQQYIDTEPTYELVASDIYNKYKADIKYIDINYIFTTDNNIIRTDMLCRDIDKEVK